MTGASCAFSRGAVPGWGFSQDTMGSSGSLSCGDRKVRSPCTCGGGARHCSRVMVGESGLKTRRRTLKVFLGSQQETLGSLDLCRWPQGASQGASEKSGILWIWERPLGTPLGLVQWKWASSRVEAGTSAFLSWLHWRWSDWDPAIRVRNGDEPWGSCLHSRWGPLLLHQTQWSPEIGRAHVWTPVTS